MGPSLILGIDIGTTNIRCYCFNSEGNVVGRSFERLPLLNFKDGRQEIVPEELWEVFKYVVKECLLSSNVNAEVISSLGIATQRGTFVTWDRELDDTYHNFITWKDQRASKDCELWNSSFFMKVVRFASYILHFLSRNRKLQLLSCLRFSTAMVLTRLYWAFQNIHQLRNKAHHHRVLFGTLDTWLVYKLTGGNVHATDASNACATGFFDPFQLQWAHWILKLFHIPSTILPVIKNTCDSYGETLAEIFGASIPINALVGDQQASLFGAGCFEKYDINCTMGTGTFLNMNTGYSPLGAYDGFYPLVGWTIASKPTYIVEGGVHDVGTVMSWAQNLGFLDHPEDSDKIALCVPDNGGVFFLPGVNAAKDIRNENLSTAAFIGLKAHTSKEHMVRAMIEALGFQVCELYRIASNKYGTKECSLFRICGGVAANNFIVQLISDVTSRNIERLNNIECSTFGAALLAGLHCGVWKNLKDIKLMIQGSEYFSADTKSARRNQYDFFLWRKSYTHDAIAKTV